MATQQYKDFLKSQGLCPRCKCPVTNRVYCDICSSDFNERSQRRRDDKKAKGLCIYCGVVPAGFNHVYCDKCLAKNNATNRNTSRDVQRSRVLKSLYGITLADYDIMLSNQNGKCKICGISESEVRSKRHFSVDHDHKTGKIRGLLCVKCNTFLGCLEEREELADLCKTYLRESQWIIKISMVTRITKRG